MAIDLALERLLQHAGISSSNYTRDLYFRGCELHEGLQALYVPDQDQADMITRCWLPQMRKVLPKLEVQVIVVPVKPKPSKAFKKGYKPEPEQADLYGTEDKSR